MGRSEGAKLARFTAAPVSTFTNSTDGKSNRESALARRQALASIPVSMRLASEWLVRQFGPGLQWHLVPMELWLDWLLALMWARPQEPLE